MKRAPLIWFGAGCLTVAASTIAARIYSDSQYAKRWQAYIVLYEPLEAVPPPPGEPETAEYKFEKLRHREGPAYAGQVLKECGIQQMNFIMPTDSNGEAWAALSDVRGTSLDCVVRRAQRENILFRFDDANYL